MTEQYTALYEEHKRLGASFTDFGGWQMPLKYSSELAEHHAVRKAAGLFDLSHMGEVEVTGPDAAAFLDYALTGRLSAVAVGRAKYSLITGADGGIIDDLISYRLEEESYLVVPNAGNAAVVAAELAARAEGFDVAVEDKTAVTSLVAVQGPEAEAILLELVPAGQQELVTGMKYYAAAAVPLAFDERTADLLVARTGYTGEDGFEIYVPNDSAPALWQALLAAGAGRGLVPAGLACRDSLRLEAGMPLYGNELSLDLDPYSAGLGGVVALSKDGDFVGRAALAAKKEQTPARKLVGLKGSGRRSARSHYPVLKDGEVVGEVTSGAPSPTLGYPVALAYVDAAFSEPGTALDVDLRGKPEPFEVVQLPFYKRDK
ncbi:glycine cleavage system aminomethyltransferase GcvT [Arthrobacter caoxuetaonis]|uniref:Aminomethyltransferase n=1 Tax=Arthrobacter caoxuetaonis TaxID=2886935 RepID=A0A9X1MF71_9MICC|nr:glycine cleavage system aminomethyltransferase GcvT [Arthrobacter caoxuetaonis]MCC3298160.1 glycine cleavage system aminomethyltransferase GcvT [Arthrobacter caoxuetaonis]USQ57164.1 glycine cleavage system aminomethyltransferase GcvT [Arthrobacter caoxuetaonis]